MEMAARFSCSSEVRIARHSSSLPTKILKSRTEISFSYRFGAPALHPPPHLWSTPPTSCSPSLIHQVSPVFSHLTRLSSLFGTVTLANRPPGAVGSQVSHYRITLMPSRSPFPRSRCLTMSNSINVRDINV